MANSFSWFLFLLSLCYFLPICYSGKMGVTLDGNKRSVLRLTKNIHKRNIRKLQSAKTIEDFIRVFERTDNVESTIQRILDDTFEENILSNQNDIYKQSHTVSHGNPLNATEVLSQFVEEENSISCLQPRPVLLDTYEVIGLDRGYLQYVYPLCLEVNRCGQHSGCCHSDAKICAVKPGHVRNVTRQVVIASRYLRPAPNPNTFEIFTVQVENHTECECQPIPHESGCRNLICQGPKTKDLTRCACSCPKRCPRPYVSNSVTCECECGEEKTQAGRVCRRLFRGKETMTKDECNCVRKRQCGVPLCRSKYHFDNTTCQCVRKLGTERIADDTQSSYRDMFAADLEVRGRQNVPSLEPYPEAGLGLDVALMVRSRQSVQQKHGYPQPDETATRKDGDVKLGDLSPDPNEYRHSSHTYNETQHINTEHNVSGSTKSTKSKLTVWEKTGDELNATNIKDKHVVDLTPNDTEHETLAKPRSADLGTLSNNIPEKSESSTEEGDQNVINTFETREDDEDAVNIDDDDYTFASSLSTYSSSSTEVETKSSDVLDNPYSQGNKDHEIYDFDDGSGDMGFGH